MIRESAFWAQALDNLSADNIEVCGWQGETLSRQQVVSLITSVVRSGTRIFDELGVQLTADSYRFVLEVPCVQRDQGGRVAPIVCLGEYAFYPFEYDERGKSTVEALDAFAKSIGREIERQKSECALKAFDVLEDRSKHPLRSTLRDIWKRRSRD
jgi:hypothetical protein